MLGYILTRLFVESFRLVPFWGLYVLSDVLRFIFYYIIKYRKEIALDNLRKAFPEKSEKEIRKIAWKSYQNLTDIMLESFKGMSLSEKSVRKRMGIENGEVCDSYAEKGGSAIYLAGHCANWEWALIADKYLKHKIVTVYKPLKNPRVDKYMRENRERLGMKVIPMKKTKDAFSITIPFALVLIADQSPSTSHNAVWVDFFNRDTPVIHGPEAYSKKFNLPLIFLEFYRIKRGYYSMKFEKFIDNPKETEEGEITQAYMKRLEQTIKEKPEQWVWTHKRWKHKRDENGNLLVDYYYKN